MTIHLTDDSFESISRTTTSSSSISWADGVRCRRKVMQFFAYQALDSAPWHPILKGTKSHHPWA